MHLMLIDIPARDDIEPEPPLTNMIGSDHLLGAEYRPNHRDMHRTKDRYALGRSQQTRGPGQRLIGRARGIGDAAIAVPAPDGQYEFQPGLIGKLGGFQIVLPRCIPIFRRQRHRQPARTVHAKQAQLKPVIVIHACALPAHPLLRYRLIRAVSLTPARG